MIQELVTQKEFITRYNAAQKFAGKEAAAAPQETEAEAETAPDTAEAEAGAGIELEEISSL